MNKFFFTFDKNKKAQSLKKTLLKKFKNTSIKKSKAIIVCGGDGFMLSNIKKFYKYKIPFYGINCGSFGFLLNNLKNSNLEKIINNSKKSVISPLKVVVKYKKNKIKSLIAINEISLFRQSRQTAIINLKIGNKYIIKKLIGDGILICTPAGSTAYNLSVNGPILSLNSGKLGVTPISPFRPRRWSGKVISDKHKIKINNLNSDNKRPVAAVADNIEIRNVTNLIISMDKKIKINILFDKDRSLTKRIKLEQIRKKSF
jgi:NAD+ kinase|tara:strand:- start:101 stop:874 length:774 start_codon:yes stop_codon:yes gene_type:complete